MQIFVLCNNWLISAQLSSVLYYERYCLDKHCYYLLYVVNNYFQSFVVKWHQEVLCPKVIKTFPKCKAQTTVSVHSKDSFPAVRLENTAIRLENCVRPEDPVVMSEDSAVRLD